MRLRPTLPPVHGLLTIITLTLLLAMPAAGQFLWSVGGVEVSGAVDLNSGERCLAAGDAGVLQVWESTADGPRVIRGQLFSATGDSLWPEARVLATAMQGQGRTVDPVLVATEDGGWLLAWLEEHPAAPNPAGVRVQRISPDGELLWFESELEPTSGALVTGADNVEGLTVLDAGDGGAWVGFITRVVGSSEYSNMLFRLDASGALAPDFPDDGMMLGITFTWTERRQLALESAGDGAVWVLWTEGHIWAAANLQRVSADGGLLPADAPLTLAPEGEGFQGASLLADGDGGVYVAWNMFEDVLIQHVEAGGEELYTPGGQTLSVPGNQSYISLGPALAFLPGGDMVLAWSTGTSLRAHRLSDNGNHATELWEQDGVSIGGTQNTLYSLQVEGDMIWAPALYVNDSGNSKRLNVYGVSLDGEPLEPPVGIYERITPWNQPSPPTPPFSFARVENTLLCGWTQHPHTVQKTLRQQGVGLGSGELLHDEGGFELRRARSIASQRAVCLDEAGDTWIVSFQGDRPMLESRSIEDGDLLVGPVDLLPAVQSSEDPLSLHTMDVALASDGSLLVLINDGRHTPYVAAGTVYAQKVSPAGELLWGDGGVALGNSVCGEYLLPTDDGGLIATWNEFESTVHATRLDSNGAPLWSDGADPFIPLPLFEGGEGPMTHSLNRLDDGLWLVVGFSESGLVGQKYDMDGLPQLATPFLLDYSPGSKLTAAPIAGGVMVAWSHVSGSWVKVFMLSDQGMWADPVWIDAQADILWLELASSGPDAESAWLHGYSYSMPGWLQRITVDGELASQVAEVPPFVSMAVNPAGDVWYGDGDGKVMHLERDGTPAPFFDVGPFRLTPDGHDATVTRLPDGGVLAMYANEETGAVELFGQRMAGEPLAVDEMLADVTTPVEFRLSPVTPNPFNPTATMSVAVPEAGLLTVDLFTITGRRVARLHHNRVNAGPLSITLDGRGLASGVYLVRASLPGHASQVRKAVLLR